MFLKTIKILVAALFVSALGSYLLNSTASFYSRHAYFSIIFFFLTGMLTNFILFRGETAPKEFVFKIMVTSMLRLLICMFGVLIYSKVLRGQLKLLAPHFILHYILFTVFEIAYLLRFSKTNNTNTNE
jgi:hypothetical protein